MSSRLVQSARWKPATSKLPGSVERYERQRVVIESMMPQVNGGQYPAKRVVGEQVLVTADVFADGHDAIACEVCFRHDEEETWRRSQMSHIGNDRWSGRFVVNRLGNYRFTVNGWVDHFASWRNAVSKKAAAQVDVSQELLIGASLVSAASKRADHRDAQRLLAYEQVLSNEDLELAERVESAVDETLQQLMNQWAERRFVSRYEKELAITVDRPRARFSTWYEMFPRSAGEGGTHGTFDDVRRMLPYVASMGFDVLYLPPIHPIGRVNRKGRNNRTQAQPEDVGSPWAIGSSEGGHKAIHPQLGTLADFRKLVEAAREYEMEIALDIAFQCAPDHPYVRDHPEWFRMRPDGTVQFAENPPKKYEDIFPFDFETDAWASLWQELRSVFEFWIEQGVYAFRVDNPHTKPLAFWEWLIADVRKDHPEVIFLSEAFTRPKLMYRLAKLGFTQSYTYFTWRNTKREIQQYFKELTQQPMIEFFRANLWPNTPDILNSHLQHGGRAAFMTRVILAGTLAASYGIYGPAFELGEHQPREPGSEEYLHSEKYEIRQWDLDRLDSLRPLITRLNRIRRDNPALQSDRSLEFHRTDNETLICYSKVDVRAVADEASRRSSQTSGVLIVVNLDPFATQSGWVQLPLNRFALDAAAAFEVHDLLTDARYTWQGEWNFVQLNPHVLPAHIFAINPLQPDAAARA